MEIAQTQSTNLLIRPAELRDLDIVYAFLCELENEQLDSIAFAAIFRQNLASEMIHYLVAEVADTVVGFVSCHVQYLLHHVGPVGEIQELFVLDAYRNQRIGRQLMAVLDGLAQQLDLVNLEVTTNRIRADTHRFYEQLGFRATHYKFVRTFTRPD